MVVFVLPFFSGIEEATSQSQESQSARSEAAGMLVWLNCSKFVPGVCSIINYTEHAEQITSITLI